MPQILELEEQHLQIELLLQVVVVVVLKAMAATEEDLLVVKDLQMELEFGLKEVVKQLVVQLGYITMGLVALVHMLPLAH